MSNISPENFFFRMSIGEVTINASPNCIVKTRRISIIVPCYNAEQYIHQCLDSILCQTYTDLQIICIDDGSTDKTPEILADFAAVDNRIHIIIQPNKGIAAARNAGLVAGSGEYVVFVDADDWLEPDALEKSLGSHAEDIICFSYYRNFREGQAAKNLGIEGVFRAAHIQRRMIGLVGNELKDITSFDALITCWGKIYRRSIIKEVRFRDLKDFGTWEDGIFNVEVLENASQVRIINMAYYHYRKMPQSSFTTNYKPDLFEKWKYKYKWLSSYLSAHQKPEIYKEALKNRIAVTTLNLAFNEMNSGLNFKSKKANLLRILTDTTYLDALARFNRREVSFQWQIFYYFAKKRNAFALTLMADLIYRLINRKNN